MDEEDDFGGYGSDELSVRAVKKSTAASSGAKRKATSAKSSVPAASTAKAPKSAPKPAATRGRGKATAGRAKGRNASAEDEDEEAEVIDIEVSEDDEEEDVEMDEPEIRRSARGKRGESSKAPTKVVNGKTTSASKATTAENNVDSSGGDEEALRQELARLKAQLTRRTEERDTFAKQFKELEGKKGGEMEKLYDKLKDKSQSKGDAQDKIIDTLTQLNEKLTSKVKSVEASLADTKKTLSSTQDELTKKAEAEKRQSEEKAVPMQVEKPVEAPSVATATATGSKEMEEEVKKWKSEAKRMRSRAEEKETELATLKKDLEAEVKISQEALAQAERRAAAAALTGSVAGPTSAKEVAADREQNEQVIKLYEDLTNLMIPQVKIVKGGNGDEITFVCVQTVQGRSLNYKLRCFKQASEDPAKAGSWIYTKVMQYLPIGLDLEKDKSFLEGLGIFKSSMEMPMAQASDFWTNLNVHMVPDEDEAE